jgi:hypothetical protein
MEGAGFFLSFYSLDAFRNKRIKIAFQLYRFSDCTGCSFFRHWQLLLYRQQHDSDPVDRGTPYVYS